MSNENAAYEKEVSYWFHRIPGYITDQISFPSCIQALNPKSKISFKSSLTSADLIGVFMPFSGPQYRKVLRLISLEMWILGFVCLLKPCMP